MRTAAVLQIRRSTTGSLGWPTAPTSIPAPMEALRASRRGASPSPAAFDLLIGQLDAEASPVARRPPPRCSGGRTWPMRSSCECWSGSGATPSSPRPSCCRSCTGP
ncbi:MAG: hypothetical protein WKF75_04330 [Singulisphaera sp.]